MLPKWKTKLKIDDDDNGSNDNIINWKLSSAKSLICGTLGNLYSNL